MARRSAVEGLRQVEQALGQLGKATGRNVMRRVAIKRLTPIADDMRERAPDDPNTGGEDLRNSIAVTTKRPRRHKKVSEVEAHAGPGQLPQAHLQEFGAPQHGPQPFARPAWDAGKDEILPGLAEDFWDEIKKAADRQARKTARLAAKG
jgi:HK97 gp10 family phage protein